MNVSRTGYFIFYVRCADGNRCNWKSTASRLGTNASAWTHAHTDGQPGNIMPPAPAIIPFCSLAVLDPRVGHTVDVLSPFIPVLRHSD